MTVVTGERVETEPSEQSDSRTPPGIPWLRVGASPAGSSRAARIDLGDPHGVAFTLDPLEPEPGFPVATHASLLSDVWCAAGRLPASAHDVLTLALLRTYDACGWDTAIGQPTAEATVPVIREVAEAVDDATEELRCGNEARGFVRVRLGELAGNGSGMFFAGGHRIDASALTCGDVEVVTGTLDRTGRALVAGTLLLRLAEHACLSPVSGVSPRHVLAIQDGESLLGSALDGLIADAAAHGEIVLLSGLVPSPDAESTADARGVLDVDRTGRLTMLSERRSAVCGRACLETGPCTRYQIRAATRLARGPEGEPLREWADALVLAFVTGRPLPAAPERVRRQWAMMRARLRECALATAVDQAVTEHTAASRGLYRPARLAAVAGRIAVALIEDGPAPSRAGQCWVPPVLRWVHEAVRVGWTGAAADGGGVTIGPGSGADLVDADDMAPPLDFAIDGLADWPGIRAGQRLALLLRHPLSAELPHNKEIVARTLGGGTGASG